jgi:HPt (histidine-containing phosphotransfer) domain-containing protein
MKGLADTLAGIDGFDPHVGLAVAGDEALFLELLDRFVTHHRDGLPGLDHYLATGQPEIAMRMSHSLKGAAAAIGAGKLRHLAADCESAIAQGEDMTRARVLASDLERELIHFVAALNGRLPASIRTHEEPAAPMSPAQLAQAIDTLGDLLASGDFGAQRFHRDIARQLRDSFGEPAQALARSVRDHDYERAFALLGTLQNNRRESVVESEAP